MRVLGLVVFLLLIALFILTLALDLDWRRLAVLDFSGLVVSWRSLSAEGKWQLAAQLLTGVAVPIAIAAVLVPVKLPGRPRAVEPAPEISDHPEASDTEVTARRLGWKFYLVAAVVAFVVNSVFIRGSFSISAIGGVTRLCVDLPSWPGGCLVFGQPPAPG